MAFLTRSNMQARNKSNLALAAIAALATIQTTPLLAITKTFDGGTGGTSADLALAANWAGATPRTLPGTGDEALFTTATGNGSSLTVSASANVTWGDLIWNNNVSNTIGNPQTGATSRIMTLSGGGGSSAAIDAGGATGDLLLMGTNASSNTLILGPNVSTGTGVINITLGTNGNFNVVNSGATLSLTGNVTGEFNLNKTGAGKLILGGSSSNTFGSVAKTFTVSAGTVELAKTGSAVSISSSAVTIGDDNTGNGAALVKMTGASTNHINNAAAVTVNSDGTLDLNGASDTIGTLSGTGTVKNDAVGLSTLTLNSTLSWGFSGSFQGNLNVTKAGTGTLTLSSSGSSHTGGTTISDGTVKLVGGNALPDLGRVTLANKVTAILDLNDTTETIGSLQAGVNNSPVVNLGAGHLTTGGDNTTTDFIGVIQGAGGRLTKTGNGTFTLKGGASNTHTGLTTVSNGTLILSKSASGVNAVAGDITVAGGATLGIGQIEQIPDSSLVTLQAGSTLDFTGVDKYETVRLAMTDATINTSGGANGSLIITGTPTFAGNNTINSRIVLANAASGNATRIFSIPSTKTLTINNSITEFDGVLGSIDKQGAGTMLLTGANAYTGATTINGGMLSISATGSINTTSGININGGELRYNSSTALIQPITFTSGKISGTGKIGVPLALGSTSILSPGNSPGSQEYGAGVDFSAGGTYLWELAAYSTSNPGADWDQIIVSGGDLVLGGTSKLSISFYGASVGNPDDGNPFWSTDHLWKIIDQTGAGTTTGNFAELLNATYAGGTFTTSTGTGDDAGDVFLHYTVVPEPASIGLVVASGMVILGGRRCRRATRSR